MSFCIVQHFDVLEVNRQLVLNEKDGPLMVKTKNFLCIESSKVISPVSIVHQCDSNCSLKRIRKSRVMEREHSEVNTLTVCHNFKTNDLYALNIYCMKNPAYC